ncbi:MAG TPA: hypothetical protein VGB85_06670 [Nannocystis sp.]
MLVSVVTGPVVSMDPVVGVSLVVPLVGDSPVDVSLAVLAVLDDPPVEVAVELLASPVLESPAPPEQPALATNTKEVTRA